MLPIRNAGLLKINPDGLVEQAALEILVLGLFGESLQAEKTGCIPFLNGYFQITGGVEKRQFFSFSHVRVAFADLIDDLVPFEDDTEAAAFASFFEFVMCDI